ncbi:hypothetical protein Srubr_68050 [Streptomyces rubradiris]|uniref:Uncharacterized protein n=1 Tax=Streptomyces rubradiris TaxID=285531 RepID=A0ABQ3RM67_STRRR|nr:hypothetical protein Srubr_68050 [Streptomyces rubradiris]
MGSTLPGMGRAVDYPGGNERPWRPSVGGGGGTHGPGDRLHRLPYCARGISIRVLAMVYHSANATLTVWAFTLSVLIVLAVVWYVRHRG